MLLNILKDVRITRIDRHVVERNNCIDEIKNLHLNILNINMFHVNG